MKLLKTIKKIIQEAEEQYNSACERNATLDEIDKAEKHYRDSLKLLKFFNSSEAKKNQKKFRA